MYVLAPGGVETYRIFSVRPTKLALLLMKMMAMMILVELNLVVPQGVGTMAAITAIITTEHPGVMSAAIW